MARNLEGAMVLVNTPLLSAPVSLMRLLSMRKIPIDVVGASQDGANGSRGCEGGEGSARVYRVLRPSCVAELYGTRACFKKFLSRGVRRGVVRR